MGWQDLLNGLLLKEASPLFDAVLTVDTRMKFQQNLSTLPIAVVILDSPRNTPEVLAPFASFVEALLPTLRVGQRVEIGSAGNVTIITPGRPAGG